MQEVWKDIKGYEGLYQVSNLGRVKRLNYWNGFEYKNGEKILKPTNQKNTPGYYRSKVKLCNGKDKRDFKVHRLVATAFIPNPNNYPIINHIDGNPLNNRVDNLEWCTQKHNMQEAINTDNSCKTIHTIDREDLVELLNNNFTYDDIAQMLNIAKGTVFNYIKRFNIKKIYR